MFKLLLETNLFSHKFVFIGNPKFAAVSLSRRLSPPALYFKVMILPSGLTTSTSCVRKLDPSKKST